MAMSKTTKYILVGGAAAVGVYLVARSMKSAGPAKPTPATAAAQVIGGVKDLWTTIKDRKGGPSGTTMPPDNSPSSVVPVYTADGNSAISNSSGLDRATYVAPTPDQPASWKDRAISGVVKFSQYATLPVRSRA